MNRRRFITIVMGAFTALAGCAARAVVVHSTPVANEVISDPDVENPTCFNNRIDVVRSRLHLAVWSRHVRRDYVHRGMTTTAIEFLLAYREA